jgi:hypothetical protein
MKSINALLIAFAAASPLCAQTPVDWNGDAYSSLKAGLNDSSPPAAAHASPAAKPPKTGSFSPSAVGGVEAFSLTKEDLAAILAGGAPPADSELAVKLERILNQVYYSAGPAQAEAQPKTLRVVSWNINDPLDGSKVDDIASVLKGDGARLNRTNDDVNAELAGLAATDIYMIQEIPLPAAIAAAKAKGYSVVWAPEFIEVGNNAEGRDPGAAQVLTGNAILSKYALSDFSVLRFARQADWYNEQNRTSLPLPDKLTRGAAKKAFDADIRKREVRAPVPYGGRIALCAKAAVPYQFNDSSGGSILIVDLHLESASKPDVRRDQMKEAAEMIGKANIPAIFGGDLNTSGNDGRIQTTGRFIAGQFDTKTKVAEKGISIGLDVAGAPTGVGEAKMAFDTWKYFHSAGDPTSIMNREHQLFDVTKKELPGVKIADETNKGNVKKYKNTWSTPSPKHLGVAVLDWMFIYDPMGNMDAKDSKTYEKLVRGSAKKGAKEDDFLSDHFPIGTSVTLTEPE